MTEDTQMVSISVQSLYHSYLLGRLLSPVLYSPLQGEGHLQPLQRLNIRELVE